MGGFNSGSRLRSETIRNDQLHRLSIRDVRRTFGAPSLSQQIRAMRPSGAGLSVRATDDGEHQLLIVRDEGPATIPYGLAEALSPESPRLFVQLVVSKPHFGGTRYWFRCPRLACGRRCAVLYREERTNARAFACRHCVRFRYETQVFGESDLILARIVKLLMRLHFDANSKVRRPKGMHRRTFREITKSLDVQVAQFQAACPLFRRFGRCLARLERKLAATGVIGYSDGTAFGTPLNQSVWRTSS